MEANAPAIKANVPAETTAITTPETVPAETTATATPETAPEETTETTTPETVPAVITGTRAETVPAETTTACAPGTRVTDPDRLRATVPIPDTAPTPATPPGMDLARVTADRHGAIFTTAGLIAL